MSYENEPLPTQEWEFVAQGERTATQDTAVYRVRKLPSDRLLQDRMPWCVTLAWRFIPMHHTRLPSPAESAQMNLLEDVLLGTLEPLGQARLLVVATSIYLREWWWYTRDPIEMLAMLNSSLTHYPAFPIKIFQMEDPRWQKVKALLGKAG
ncbi:MAG TPA: DUF695 domain-containing protein [Anaerolineales bacterium]|nr:DUF695 domain-containing protein [Anaerolineales bacterium]